MVPLGDVGEVFGASWGEDGNILVGVRGKGLVRIRDGGGAPETVAAPADGEVALAFPQILPGGKAVLFSAYTALNADASSIEVMTLADHNRKTVSRGGTFPRYLATSNGTGHLVYINKATLFAVPFDQDKLEIHGTPVPIVDDVAFNGTLGAGQLSFSRSGTLVYRRSGGDAGLTHRCLAGQRGEDTAAAGEARGLWTSQSFARRPEAGPGGGRGTGHRHRGLRLAAGYDGAPDLNRQ